MKSAIFDEFGAPEDVVKLVESSPDSIQSGQVRVKVLACPINPADINYIEGRYGVKPTLPAIPGMEACVEVLESQSDAFSTGDHAIFLTRGGSWREELIVTAESLIPVPRTLDPLQASMLSVNPLTAFCILNEFINLNADDWLIQNAANSNVGRCLIQLAAQRGIKTINIVRREELIPELQDLGATHVFLESDDLQEQLRAHNIPAPRLASNCVGGDSALQQLKVLAKHGAQVTYGAMAKQPLKVPAGLMIFKSIALHGFWVSEWVQQQPRENISAIYAELAEKIAAGQLTQAIDKTYPLSEVKSALIAAQKSQRAGKIILIP